MEQDAHTANHLVATGTTFGILVFIISSLTYVSFALMSGISISGMVSTLLLVFVVCAVSFIGAALLYAEGVKKFFRQFEFIQQFFLPLFFGYLANLIIVFAFAVQKWGGVERIQFFIVNGIAMLCLILLMIFKSTNSLHYTVKKTNRIPVHIMEFLIWGCALGIAYIVAMDVYYIVRMIL